MLKNKPTAKVVMVVDIGSHASVEVVVNRNGRVNIGWWDHGATERATPTSQELRDIACMLLRAAECRDANAYELHKEG